MLSLKEYIELKEDLLNGIITHAQAEEVYWDNYDEKKKSWHTKDWKVKRDKIIKSECEICGSEERLTLQHLSHPKKHEDYIKQLTAEYTQVFRESNPVIRQEEFLDYLIKNYEHSPLELCPICNSRHPNVRSRKKPKYLCGKCRHEFEEPYNLTLETTVELYFTGDSPVQIRGKRLISFNGRGQIGLDRAMSLYETELAKEKYAEEISYGAILLLLHDNIKYLSFEDTITACNKCAFSRDINNSDLCPKCKKKYKKVYYQTCFDCLPEEKRKEVRERIEFQKSMDEMIQDMESGYW